MQIIEIFYNRKLQIRMLDLKKHQYLLDPNHITQIIAKIKPICLTSRAHRTDQDRLLYSRLIEYSANYLHQITQQLPDGLNASLFTLQHLSKQFFSPLFQEVISLAKRQCSEKAQILRMLYDFYEEGIGTVQKVCQQKIKSLTAEYYLNWKQKEEALLREQTSLRNKIKQFEEENQKKWKTFYLVVRDNRVLRRQKGKLMRTIQEERTKIANIHQEMINIARENQKNKLLANYQEERQSFPLFLKNSVSINKLERFMKDYPKISKRLLKIDLHQLQVAEQNLLNQKIQYILKTASEFQQIYDEYQDLIDIAKPNKILFNACTQTDCEETPQSQEQIAIKAALRNKFVQTYSEPKELISGIFSVCLGKKEPEKCRRRRGAHIEKNEVTKIQAIKNEIVNPITSNDMQIINRQVFVKIAGISRLSDLIIDSKTVDIWIGASLQEENPVDSNQYPNLPTKFKLNKDISRSKEYIYKKGSQRSSRFSGITNLTSSLASHSQTLIKAVESSNFKNNKRKDSNNSKPGEPLTRSSFKTLSSLNNINPFKSKLSRLNTENLQLTEHFQGFGEWNEVIDEQEEGKLAYFQEKVQAETKQQKEDFGRQKSHLGSKRQSRAGNLNGKPPLNNLFVPKTSHKKLRKSGFATNKPGAKYLEMSSDLTNRETVRLGNQVNAPRKSQLTISVDPFQLEATESKMVAASKDKNPRQPTQIKNINIFSQEYSRLADKLLKAIYSQRKELSEGKTTFEQFLRSFMTNQYGSHLQFSLATKITGSRSDHSPLAEAFDILLNGYESPAYLQICFGIFAKILSANGSWVLQVDPEKAQLIYGQLMKSLLGDEQSEALPQSNQINLCNLFIQIQQSFHRKLRQSQLFHFLQLILPRSQQVLTFEQLRQMFSIFIGEDNHLKRLFALKQFCKSDISPLALCTFAFREKWDSMVNVSSFITNKFTAIFGEASTEWTELILERCSRSEKIRWISNLLKSSLLRIDSPSEQSLKTKYLSLLFVTYQVEKILPITQPLLDISQQYELLMIKNNLSLNTT